MEEGKTVNEHVRTSKKGFSFCLSLLQAHKEVCKLKVTGIIMKPLLGYAPCMPMYATVVLVWIRRKPHRALGIVGVFICYKNQPT